MICFVVGDAVTWTVTVRGIEYRHDGVVDFIVYPGQRVRDAVADYQCKAVGAVLPKSRVCIDFLSQPRPFDSYLVRAMNGVVYWPRVSGLKKRGK